LWPTLTSVLVAVSIAVSAHIATHVVAIHLHAGFRASPSVATISTVRATVRESGTSKSTGSHKGRCAKDGREAVANAAEA
jgi:hypothetical protein